MTIIEATAGESVWDVINRGIDEAKKARQMVMIKHNGIAITVSPQSYSHDLCNLYDAKKRLTQVLKQSI